MRVAIAEDSVLLREGLARLLEEADFDVVARCEDAQDLLVKVRSFSPDVAIVDIRLPPTHNDEGLQAALEIRKQHPSMGVLVLSQYVEVGLALTLLAESAEGVGYLLKDRIGDVKEFVSAVRASRDGRLRARPDHRLDTARQAADGRPDLAADSERAGCPRADGRRAAPTRVLPTSW